MRRVTRFLRLACLAAPLLCPATLLAQDSFVLVTPGQAHMLIGESRVFRLVDQNGNMQHDVSWTISDRYALQAEESDELSLAAKETGVFRISGRSANGSAEATVTVMEGTSLPMGTKIWSGPTIEGCKSIKATPAVPSASGTDVFDQSTCADGEYISAYTSDGILQWRRKIGTGGTPSGSIASASPARVSNNVNTFADNRLNPRALSVCDSISLGTDQQKIRDLLKQRKLPFAEGTTGEHVWTVEESNTQCKLWFDNKAALTKKTKVFVSE